MSPFLGLQLRGERCVQDGPCSRYSTGRWATASFLSQTDKLHVLQFLSKCCVNSAGRHVSYLNWSAQLQSHRGGCQDARLVADLQGQGGLQQAGTAPPLNLQQGLKNRQPLSGMQTCSATCCAGPQGTHSPQTACRTAGPEAPPGGWSWPPPAPGAGPPGTRGAA